MRKRLILGGTAVLALGLVTVLFGIVALAPHNAFAATVRHVKGNCGGQLPPVCYTTVHDAVNAAAAGEYRRARWG